MERINMATAKKATAKKGGSGEEESGPGEEGGGSCEEGGAGQEGRSEEGSREEADPERRLHEGDDAEPRARRRHRRQAGSAHRGHQEGLGLHQEEQPQDATKRTMINADAKLKEIFKKAQVSMFEMTKLINGHLS
jgi:hypothetical protein